MLWGKRIGSFDDEINLSTKKVEKTKNNGKLWSEILFEFDCFFPLFVTFFMKSHSQMIDEMIKGKFRLGPISLSML